MQMRLSARKVTWRFVVPHGLLTGFLSEKRGHTVIGWYSTVNARGSYAVRETPRSNEYKIVSAYGTDSPYVKSLPRFTNRFHDNLSSRVSRRDPASDALSMLTLIFFPLDRAFYLQIVPNSVAKRSNAGSRNLILKKKKKTLGILSE